MTITCLENAFVIFMFLLTKYIAYLTLYICVKEREYNSIPLIFIDPTSLLSSKLFTT